MKLIVLMSKLNFAQIYVNKMQTSSWLGTCFVSLFLVKTQDVRNQFSGHVHQNMVGNVPALRERACIEESVPRISSMECRGRAVECIGLEFWGCQNVGSNPGLAGRGDYVLEQDTYP